MAFRTFCEKIYKRTVIFYYNHFEKNIEIGEDTGVRRHLYLRVAHGGKITIGKGCFFNHNFSAQAFEDITIGDNCIFGENVKIYDHNHVFNTPELIKDAGFKIAPVRIGSNCWIGSDVTILKGVTIGDNCVIGAGGVLRESVPDNTLVKFNVESQYTRIEKVDIRTQ